MMFIITAEMTTAKSLKPVCDSVFRWSIIESFFQLLQNVNSLQATLKVMQNADSMDGLLDGVCINFSPFWKN